MVAEKSGPWANNPAVKRDTKNNFVKFEGEFILIPPFMYVIIKKII